MIKVYAVIDCNVEEEECDLCCITNAAGDDGQDIIANLVTAELGAELNPACVSIFLHLNILYNCKLN